MSIFSKIAAGEIPSYKCAESDKFYAFLDINPVALGHTLVIPRQETDYIFDLDDELLAEYQVFAKRVARAIETVLPCRKVGMAVIGLEVPHAHIHLIPLKEEGDMDFRKPKLEVAQEKMAEDCRSHTLPLSNKANASAAFYRPQCNTDEKKRVQSLYFFRDCTLFARILRRFFGVVATKL